MTRAALLSLLLMAGCATGPSLVGEPIMRDMPGCGIADSTVGRDGKWYSYQERKDGTYEPIEHRTRWDGQDTAAVFGLGLAVEAAYIVGGHKRHCGAPSVMP